MAITRKFLAAMGIESEKADEIIKAHTDTVNNLKDELETAKKETEQSKADAEKLSKLQKKLDEMKEAQGKEDPFEPKYNELKAEFDKYKADISAKETAAKKRDAYKALLKEAGISDKRLEAVLKVSDVDGIELDENGAIKDAEERVKSVKEEWADFIQTQGIQGANTPNPPANTGGSHDQHSRAALLAAKYHENLYGKAKE